MSGVRQKGQKQLGLFGGSGVIVPPALSAAEEIRAMAWREGRRILRFLTGCSESQAGTRFGRILRDARDDCSIALHVMKAAEDLRPVEPMAWITRAVRSRASDRAVTEQIAGDWDLIGIEDLDANAARLMARDAVDHDQKQIS